MRVLGTLAVAILLPALACADTLININTADATLLDTLPGIGPTYASRIVDYRTLHGPFAQIEDIQNVSGIGPSTYADIAPFITVGSTSSNTNSVVATTTTTTSAGGATTYVPPPATISIDIGPDSTAHLEVPLTLTASVKAKGTADPSAVVRWSFGDGSSGEGRIVEKTYRYAGTYLVTATAKDGSAVAHDDMVVVAKPAMARIASVTNEGVVIANDASERLDLSGWWVHTETGLFRLPEGTMLLPSASALFPYEIMNLPIAFSARLTYPDGVLAASFSPAASIETAPSTPEQPQPVLPRYISVQAETTPIINPTANAHFNEEAVRAPTSTVEPAAVGAALASELPQPVSSSIPSVLRSPWILGLLGVIAVAGGAFILL